MTRDRNFRRHQTHRAKGRARRTVVLLGLPHAITPKVIGRWATDRTPCSCVMCGNPRHFTGEASRQELIHALTIGG